MKILVIDDDQDILTMLEDFFKAVGWNCHGAAMGEDGFQRAKAIVPDIVLLDVSLPDVDGWEVLSRLKSDTSLENIPVVMMSGKFMESEHVVSGLKGGAEDYIRKPLDPMVLFSKMKAILKLPT